MFFKKKHEFRPDKTHSGALSKLYITKKQRITLLKWLLMALVMVALSVLQDTVLCRLRLLGATTDLLYGALLLVCILLDPEQGCIFILAGSCLYCFSGSAPGPYVIALLTLIGLLISIFRFLRAENTAAASAGGTRNHRFPRVRIPIPAVSPARNHQLPFLR